MSQTNQGTQMEVTYIDMEAWELAGLSDALDDLLNQTAEQGAE
jgi:hypothetical protein